MSVPHLTSLSLSYALILLKLVTYRALQSAAQDLERQRATDSLKKGLEKRPEKEQLIERTSLFLITTSLTCDGPEFPDL